MGRKQKQKMSNRVLGLYKRLHRTTQKVFQGDPMALGQAYNKVRHEFEKNKHVTSETSIEELLNFGESADEVLRRKVIELEFGENTMYRDDITKEQYRQRNRESRKCSEKP